MQASRRRLFPRVAASVAVAALLALTACSSGGGAARTGGGGDSAAYAPVGESDLTAPPVVGGTGGGRRTTADVATAAPATAEPAAAPVPDAAIRVTWEALAVERERFENPTLRRGRGSARGALATQRVVIVSESHPDAEACRAGNAGRQARGISVATLPDRDMVLFLRGLEQRGFFQVAKPTMSLERLFDDPNARGRVTVERGGRSWTLLSMRGQGLDPATKAIPALYSETKQSVLVLRNATPTLSVVGFSREPLR